MPKSYLVQEEDGTSRFELEEGDGFILLEEFGVAAIVTGADRAKAIVTGQDLGIVVSGSDRAVASVSGDTFAPVTIDGGDREAARVRRT